MASSTDRVLYISDLPQSVTDEEIAESLYECRPLRINLVRGRSRHEDITGTVEFQRVESAEKAYACRELHRLDQHGCTYRLSRNQDPARDAQPQPGRIVIKSLPDTHTASDVFDLCRRFGAIHTVQLQRRPPLSTFQGVAIVHFFEEGSAVAAKSQLHFQEVDGMTISVEPYDEKRANRPVGRDWAEAQAFVPRSQQPVPREQQSVEKGKAEDKQPWISPARPASSALPTPDLSPDSPSRTGDVDYCNLHVLNLPSDLDGPDLFDAFKRFGRIVSARVMKTPQGASRGFGFVSFTTPESAALARREMDGQRVGKSAGRSFVKFHVLRRANAAAAGSEVLSTGSADVSLSRKAAGLGLSEASSSSSEDLPDPAPRLLPTSDHDRLLTALLKLPTPGDRLEQIVDLLLQLPLSDRKMCLFNGTHLATKAAEAREVLDAMDSTLPSSPSPPQPPSSTPTATVKYTSATELAVLPATAILSLATTASPLLRPGLLPPIPSAEKDSTDDFVDKLAGLSPALQKQRVGERVFQQLKSLGFKKASAPAVALVDGEDLRALAHLLSYPDVLRAKAVLLGAK